MSQRTNFVKSYLPTLITFKAVWVMQKNIIKKLLFKASDNERFNGSHDTGRPCRRLIPDSYPYSPGGLVTMLERVRTRSRMLDPIQLVNDDVIDSIFRLMSFYF